MDEAGSTRTRDCSRLEPGFVPRVSFIVLDHAAGFVFGENRFDDALDPSFRESLIFYPIPTTVASFDAFSLCRGKRWDRL